MEVILSMLNSIPSPYSDFVAVAVIFVLIALISFIIAFLVERKAQKQAQGLEIEEDVKPPAETQEVIEDLDVAGDLDSRRSETSACMSRTARWCMEYRVVTLECVV